MLRFTAVPLALRLFPPVNLARIFELTVTAPEASAACEGHDTLKVKGARCAAISVILVVVP